MTFWFVRLFIYMQHFIYEMVVTTLVHAQRYYQLHQFLQYHILSDSKLLVSITQATPKSVEKEVQRGVQNH